MRFILIFLALFIAEIWSLFMVGARVGFLGVLSMRLAMIIVGGVIVGSRGRRLKAMLMGIPVSGNHEGVVWGVASGFLFMFPGFFSDLLGLALWVPQVRRLAGRLLGVRLARAARPG
ncbi:MAG: FxsA family protein, partial [Succinivibrionaceae bacterium]|nr:FxsA family protein [Succinivibrionaceae bacterium]